MKIITKILILVSLLVALVMGGISVVVTQKSQEAVYEQIDQILGTNLEFSVTEVLKAQQSVKSTAEVIARNRAVSKALYLNVSRGINQILNDLIGVYPVFNYILVADPDGEVFSTSTQDSEGKRVPGEQLLGLNITDNPLYEEAHNKYISMGRPGTDTYLNLMELTAGKSQWIIAPIKKRGKLIGWIVLSYKWEQELSSLLQAINNRLVDVGTPAIETILSNAEGNIVLSSKSSTGKLNDFSSEFIRSQDVNFGSLSPNLSIINDRDKINAPLAETRNFMILIVSISAVFLIGVLFIVLRQILLRRIAVLSEGTVQLGQGNLAHRLPEKGRDELSQLSQAFNQMTAQLQDTTVSRNDLVKEVEVRKDIEAGLLLSSEKLKQSNHELEQFAYVASHDLKAPLRAIHQLVSWIEEDLEELNNEDVTRYLKQLRGRSDRMQGLLDSLLDYSKVGKRQGEKLSFESSESIKQVVYLLEPAEGMDISVPDEMPVIEGEKALFEQIMMNLIGNAIKHGESDSGFVEIKVSLVGDKHLFSVSDNGPGIEPRHQEKIFGMFQTLKPRDEVEGSGMGLAIVKKAVEYRGGTVSVESNPEEKPGTTFKFSW